MADQVSAAKTRSRWAVGAVLAAVALLAFARAQCSEAAEDHKAGKMKLADCKAKYGKKVKLAACHKQEAEAAAHAQVPDHAVKAPDPAKSEAAKPVEHQAEMPKVEAPKAEMPKAETPKLAAKPQEPLKFIKGGNVSAWNITDVAKVFADAERLGLDTITVPVRIDMAAATSSEVKVDGPSLEFAKKVIATKPNFHYIIEPYPWIDNGNVPETDLNPADKPAWFASYQTAVASLGKQFPEAWGLYIASNLIKLEDQSALWMALVKHVRSVYAGRIIYRTQWWATAAWAPETVAAYQAKLNNPLFGVVDVIGIAAYFEVIESAAPTVAQIKAALRSTTVFNRKQDIYAEVMALNQKWQKPIFLGELSCPSVDFGAQTPWDPAASETPNPDIQKNYLTAYMETFVQDPSKFLGFSLFTIGHPTKTPYELAPSAAAYVRAFHP